MEIFRDFQTWRFWRRFLTMAFACFGGISTILQTINVTFGTVPAFSGWSCFGPVLVISLVAGLIFSWPRPITQDYSSPKTKISIVKGDILKEASHIVVGTTDTFDTEPPKIIAPSSLQGQVLQRLYGGDLKRLDTELTAALAGKPILGTVAKAGKQDRYGVGAIATLTQSSGRLIFFSAYCEMDVNNVSRSSPDKIWRSLCLLWEEISARGNGHPVAIPVIGGGQARVSNLLPAQDAIRLTVLSFMFASRDSKICDELRVIVRPEDYRKLDRLELQSFLSSLRQS